MKEILAKNTLAAALIAVGLCCAGCFIYKGMSNYAKSMASKDRSVSVKGLSTRVVKADYAVWPLSYAASGDDLPALYRYLEGRTERLRIFLIGLGFKSEDIKQGSISVSDNWDSYYGDHRPDYNYTLSTSLIVSTDNVDLVVESQGKEAELLKEGMIVTSSSWSLDYQYNGLSDLKPAMIEEATKNARKVAEKFAEDAQCELGSIRNASQGQFSVEDDEYQPWYKHVRVVTTVDYFLE